MLIFPSFSRFPSSRNSNFEYFANRPRFFGPSIFVTHQTSSHKFLVRFLLLAYWLKGMRFLECRKTRATFSFCIITFSLASSFVKKKKIKLNFSWISRSDNFWCLFYTMGRLRTIYCSKWTVAVVSFLFDGKFLFMQNYCRVLLYKRSQIVAKWPENFLKIASFMMDFCDLWLVDKRKKTVWNLNTF